MASIAATTVGPDVCDNRIPIRASFTAVAETGPSATLPSVARCFGDVSIRVGAEDDGGRGDGESAVGGGLLEEGVTRPGLVRRQLEGGDHLGVLEAPAARRREEVGGRDGPGARGPGHRQRRVEGDERHRQLGPGVREGDAAADRAATAGGAVSDLGGGFAQQGGGDRDRGRTDHLGLADHRSDPEAGAGLDPIEADATEVDEEVW